MATKPLERGSIMSASSKSLLSLSSSSLTTSSATNNSKKKLDLTKDQLIKLFISSLTPTELLKFGKSGRPAFRIFRLNEEFTALTWQSKTKTTTQTKIEFKDVKEIVYGQRTEKFRHHNRSDLEHLSFSLYYDDGKTKGETLDLVCKDEKEFQVWTKVLDIMIGNKLEESLLDEIKQACKQRKVTTGNLVLSSKDMGGANDVYAFGWGEWGQNGFGTNETHNQTTPKVLETMLGKGVLHIACGWSHTSLYTENCQLLQYGSRNGTGLSEDVFLPTPITTINEKTNVLQVACGHFHSAVLTAGGTVLTWGCNAYGQLGHGDTKDLKEPKLVTALASPGKDQSPIVVERIVCGANSMAVLTEDVKVYTWGCGERGALGHNDCKDKYVPTLVKKLEGLSVRMLAAGDGHMVAATDCETWAWGANCSGQLGISHSDDQHKPTALESMRGLQVISLACGAVHTMAIVVIPSNNAHSVYAWGSNSEGQLGISTRNTKKILTPLAIQMWSGKVKPIEVQCGALHTVIRTDSGEVWTAGNNKYGQLGHSYPKTTMDEFKHVDSLKGKNATYIACGSLNTAVLTARAWVEDSEAKECMSCKAAFTLMNRKHHCRNCGGIFCGTCSSKKTAILKYGITDQVRVCEKCYSKLGGRSS
eukprot:TRINITY_DN8942_c0_g1_i1.p1 TRINITY_DN8942_c0_g1~~TRINITY_DN8942_c0_g1_i1.p1  ORF type:complete len:646 (+),score=156.25 TRINITY_DN8942_c0_g1_i1:101-2038(+)